MGKTINNSQSNIVDIDLSALRKKRFRVDGDDNRIIELNTSDLGIIPRLKQAYPKLQNLTTTAMQDWPDEMPEDDPVNSKEFENAASILEKIDTEMRELIDYIFDSKISDICAPFGSMYDPIGGGFRYEHIINTIGSLYETDITAEVNKLSKRVQKHTNKYTKAK